MATTLFQYKTAASRASSSAPSDIIGGFGGGTHVRNDLYTFNSLVQVITDQYFGNNGSIPINEFDTTTQKSFTINAVNPFVHPETTLFNEETIIKEANELPDDSVKRINITTPSIANLVELQPGQTLEDFINGYMTQDDYDASIQAKVKSFDTFYKKNTFLATDYNFLEDESFSFWQGLDYITPDTNLNEPARYVRVRDISRKEFIFPSQYQIEPELIQMIEYYDTLLYSPMFDYLGRPIVGYGHIIQLGDVLDGTTVTPDIMKILMDTTTNQYEMIYLDHDEAEAILITELQTLLTQIAPYLGNKLVLPGMMRALLSLVRNVGFDNFLRTIEGRRILAAIRFNYMEYFIDNWTAFNNPYGGQDFVTNVNSSLIPGTVTFNNNADNPNPAPNPTTANLKFIPFSLYNTASLVTAMPSLPSSLADPTPIATQTPTLVPPPTSVNGDATASAALSPNPINPYTPDQAAQTVGPNPNAFDNKPVDPNAYKCFLPSPQDNLGIRRSAETSAAASAPDSSTQAAGDSTVQTQTNAPASANTDALVGPTNTVNTNPTTQANAQVAAIALLNNPVSPANIPTLNTAQAAGILGVEQGESPGVNPTTFGGYNNSMYGIMQFSPANQQQLAAFANDPVYNTTGSNNIADPNVQTQFALTQSVAGNPYTDSLAASRLANTGFWSMTDPVQASYAWNYAYERNNSVAYSNGSFVAGSLQNYSGAYATKTANNAENYYSILGGQ